MISYDAYLENFAGKEVDVMFRNEGEIIDFLEGYLPTEMQMYSKLDMGQKCCGWMEGFLKIAFRFEIEGDASRNCCVDMWVNVNNIILIRAC